MQIPEVPASLDGPWARHIRVVDLRGIGTLRYPRLVSGDERAARELKKRSFTNLCNERPTWTALAHPRPRRSRV